MSLHRQGYFYESSLLAVAMCGFGPILAALGRRISPMLRLSRSVMGGDRGLARVVAEELEEDLVPLDGLTGSPYFPDSTYGGIIFDKATMGFFVLQHVAGPEDPETGLRKVWTRRWPTWAVTFNPYRHTFYAQTDSGPVDILNDGKFTLGADTDDPHLTASIVALGEEAVDGKQTQRARASWIQKYGNPKWWGTMPEGIAPDTDIGHAFFNAIATVRGPDGFALGPHGSGLDIKGLSTGQSDGFSTALSSNLAIVAMIIDGSDGPSAPSGTGVYPSPHKFATARTMTDRDLRCVVRAINTGHVGTMLAINHTAAIEEARARGIWKVPVFQIGPLPDPEADERIASVSDRMKAATEQVVAERAAGYVVDQLRSDRIYKEHGLEGEGPTLADTTPNGGAISSDDEENGIVTVNEVRARKNLPPTAWGQVTVPEHKARVEAGWTTNESGWVPPPEEAPANGVPSTKSASTGGATAGATEPASTRKEGDAA